MNKRQILSPLIYSLLLAIGLLLGYRFATHRSTSNAYNDGSTKVDEVLYYVNRSYVDSVDLNQMQDDAIVELLSQLDPHSQYITKEEYNEVNDPLEGNFEGIGVTFRIEKDTITVINTIKGGPSERVGVRAGDRIVMVNDSLVAGVGINNSKVMKLLKGPRNSRVKLSVSRRGVNDLLTFDVRRDVIPTTSIDAAFMLDKEIGYIKLNKFSATSYNEFVKALSKLRGQGMQKLIFDLRGNSGGYLNAATSIVDELLPKGKLIVYTEGRNRPRTYLNAKRRGMWENKDLVVLIDGGSASASEIVAGALQDNDRGTIIGRRSFGKGLVQEPIMLSDESSIRLTVARYYTPTGRCIQKPFDGDREDYILEEYERYTTGELFSADSIHFADSLKYVTPGGKIVYGGGGIMPDVYVPLNNDSTEYFFNQMANAGIVFQSAFQYADSHRAQIEKFGNVEKFNKEFRFTDAMFESMVAEAAKKDITCNRQSKAVARKLSEITFKAYVAQNVFGDESFYQIHRDIDDVLQTAIETLNNQ